MKILVVSGEVWSICLDGALRIWSATTAECKLAFRRMDRIADIVACRQMPGHGGNLVFVTITVTITITPHPPQCTHYFCVDLADGHGDVVWIAFRNPSSLERIRAAPSKRLVSPFEASANEVVDSKSNSRAIINMRARADDGSNNSIRYDMNGKMGRGGDGAAAVH